MEKWSVGSLCLVILLYHEEGKGCCDVAEAYPVCVTLIVRPKASGAPNAFFLASHVQHTISDIFLIHLGDKAGDRDALNGCLGQVGENCKRAGR